MIFWVRGGKGFGQLVEKCNYSQIINKLRWNFANGVKSPVSVRSRLIHKGFRHSYQNGGGSSSCIVSPVHRTQMWDAGDWGCDVTWSVSERLVCVPQPCHCHRHRVIPGPSLAPTTFNKLPAKGGSIRKIKCEEPGISSNLTVRQCMAYLLLFTFVAICRF